MSISNVSEIVKNVRVSGKTRRRGAAYNGYSLDQRRSCFPGAQFARVCFNRVEACPERRVSDLA
jgi:hypothetical protein